MKFVVEPESKSATTRWTCTVTGNSMAFFTRTPASAWRETLGEGEGSDHLLHLREHGRSSGLHRHLVIEEVIGLEVEEALTYVVAHIGLITVEA
jgi:hypothetical protein